MRRDEGAGDFYRLGLGCALGNGHGDLHLDVSGALKDVSLNLYNLKMNYRRTALKLTSATLAGIALSTSTVCAKSQIIGNPDYIHLVEENGTWWFADHTGKQFITTGMNHVDEGKILFNEVNEGWMQKKFGQYSGSQGPQRCRYLRRLSRLRTT